MSTTTITESPSLVPARPRIGIPRWAPVLGTPSSPSPSPTTTDLPPPEPGTSPGPRPSPDEAGGVDLDGPSTPKRGRAGRRTTSSGGDDERPAVTPAQVAGTLGKLLLVLAGLGAWLASRADWELRVPDEDETDDVAEPIARILVRHCGTRFLTDDLVDGVQASAGVVSYVQTSPLRRHRAAAAEPDGPLPAGMEEI